MASHNISLQNKLSGLPQATCGELGRTNSRGLPRAESRGFSLLEVLVVMAITVFLIAIGSFLSIGMYQAYLFRSETSTFVSALERARSRAMANYFSSPWAVCYATPNYTVVQGSDCSGTVKDTIIGNANVTFSSPGFPSGGVVFSQLSGASTAVTLTLTDGVRTSSVTINNEGTIIW